MLQGGHEHRLGHSSSCEGSREPPVSGGSHGGSHLSGWCRRSCSTSIGRARSGWAHNVSAVFTILGSALLIDVAIRAKHWFMTPLLAAVALFMVYGNTKQAARTLSLGGEAVREAKLAEIAGGRTSPRRGRTSKTGARRRCSSLERRRSRPSKLSLEAAKNSDPSRWAATSQCEDVSLKASGTFCARVAQARGKIAAAKARDQIDADLRALPVPKMIAPKEGQEAPMADGLPTSRRWRMNWAISRASA